MTSIRRTTNHLRKRSRKTTEGGKTSNAYGMDIQQKQSTCSMQFPSKSQRHSSQKVHLETQNTANSQSNTEQKEQC
jgi:hypothetical protein